MATFKKVLSVLLAVVMAFSVFSVAASAVTTGGTDSLATLTLDTEKLTVDPGDEIVVTAYLTTNFYAASYTIPWFYSKNIFTPVSAAYADGSPFADYAKIQYNAALNTNLVKNQFGTKTLAWTANPVLAANGLTAADITKDNFQDYFYYATCTITPNSQIGPQAAIFDNNAIVDYTFKVADDAAPGTVGVIWFDQSYGWATTNTGGIFKIACYKDGVGTVGTSTTACYTDVSSDASRLVFTVAGAEEEKADKTELEAAIATLPTVSQDIATSASWKAYTDALATAQSVFADDAATQDAVDAAKNALLTAINNVAELGFCDYTALNAAIADYEATLADKADYTADSWADYEAAYTAAKAVETNLRNDEAGVNAAKIAAATKALTDAKAALKDAPTEEPEEGEAAHIDIVTSNANPKPGDEVTIDVYLTTNFYAAATQIPVIFDSNYFSLVTTGTAYTNAVTIPTSSPFNAYARPNGNITSPARAYPSSYTTEMKAQWKMVYMQFAPSSSVGTQAAMFDNDLIFSFKLKVNEDATVGGTGLVKIDIANFEKTLTNTGGNFYVSYYADGVGEVGTTVTAYGQKHTVTDASMVITAGEVELKDADYTAVEAAKANIPADLTIYTDDTVATLNAAVAAVVEGLKEDEQARVDKFAADIEAAITALELKPADYTVVETAKAKIPADLTIYTDDTVAVLNRAVAAVVEGLDITKQAEVNAYAAAIDTAVAGLTLKAADYTAVEAAKAKVPADLTIYTNGDAVTAAVEAVVYGLDITKQADVDAMAQAIEDAIAALTLKAADYTAVEAAKAKVPEDLTIYTNGDAVTAAVEAVVYGLDITKQAEVDAMAQAIEDAIAALTLKAADYTAVEAAKAKVPADLSIYTADSIEALNEALAAVVEGLDITKQAEVDAMAKAIEDAIINLDVIGCVIISFTTSDELKSGEYADLEVLVDRPVFKLQIVRDNLTWTYTRDSEFVAITTNDDGTEKWTISHMMYETEMNLFVHARTYEFGWQDAGKYLTIETTDVLTAYSIDVAVADTAVFTVKTTTDVAKIQIIDANGNTKTLNAGYEDVDGVRVWTYERVLADGEYTYTVKVRGLNTAWADTNATTTFRVGAPTEGTIKSATTDKDYYFLGDTVTLTVVTDVAVSKIQYTDNNGNTKTLADGYVEADGVRTWTITVTPADFADYEYTFSAKTAAGWAATDVTVSFTVYY